MTPQQTRFNDASPSPVSPVLDATAIARLRELDPNGQARLIERVIEAYLGSADRLIAQLNKAQLARDGAGIRMVAHTLKSSSASVGATALAKACSTAEALARDHGPGEALDMAVDRMSAHLAQTLQALRELQLSLTR